MARAQKFVDVFVNERLRVKDGALFCTAGSATDVNTKRVRNLRAE